MQRGHLQPINQLGPVGWLIQGAPNACLCVYLFVYVRVCILVGVSVYLHLANGGS